MTSFVPRFIIQNFALLAIDVNNFTAGCYETSYQENFDVYINILIYQILLCKILSPEFIRTLNSYSVWNETGEKSQ